MHQTQKLKWLLGAFTLAVCLFGLPAGSGTALIPTVGGAANAYAPCHDEYVIMQVKWDEYLTFGGQWAYLEYLDAYQDWHHCMAG